MQLRGKKNLGVVVLRERYLLFVKVPFSKDLRSHCFLNHFYFFILI